MDILKRLVSSPKRKPQGDYLTLSGERLLLPPVEEISTGDEEQARRVINEYLGPSIAAAIDLRDITRVDCFEPCFFHEAVRGTLASYNKIALQNADLMQALILAWKCGKLPERDHQAAFDWLLEILNLSKMHFLKADTSAFKKNFVQEAPEIVRNSLVTKVNYILNKAARQGQFLALEGAVGYRQNAARLGPKPITPPKPPARFSSTPKAMSTPPSMQLSDMGSPLNTFGMEEPVVDSTKYKVASPAISSVVQRPTPSPRNLSKKNNLMDTRVERNELSLRREKNEESDGCINNSIIMKKLDNGFLDLRSAILRQVPKFKGCSGEEDVSLIATGHWSNFIDFLEAYGIKNFDLCMQLFKATLEGQARRWLETIVKMSSLEDLRTNFLGRYDKTLRSRYTASSSFYDFTKNPQESWGECAIRLKQLNQVLRYKDDAVLVDRFILLLDGPSRILVKNRGAQSFEQLISSLHYFEQEGALKSEAPSESAFLTTDSEATLLARSILNIQEEMMTINEKTNRRLVEFEEKLLKGSDRSDKAQGEAEGKTRVTSPAANHVLGHDSVTSGPRQWARACSLSAIPMPAPWIYPQTFCSDPPGSYPKVLRPQAPLCWACRKLGHISKSCAYARWEARPRNKNENNTKGPPPQWDERPPQRPVSPYPRSEDHVHFNDNYEAFQHDQDAEKGKLQSPPRYLFESETDLDLLPGSVNHATVRLRQPGLDIMMNSGPLELVAAEGCPVEISNAVFLGNKGILKIENKGNTTLRVLKGDLVAQLAQNSEIFLCNQSGQSLSSSSKPSLEAKLVYKPQPEPKTAGNGPSGVPEDGIFSTVQKSRPHVSHLEESLGGKADNTKEQLLEQARDPRTSKVCDPNTTEPKPAQSMSKDVNVLGMSNPQAKQGVGAWIDSRHTAANECLKASNLSRGQLVDSDVKGNCLTWQEGGDKDTSDPIHQVKLSLAKPNWDPAEKIRVELIFHQVRPPDLGHAQENLAEGAAITLID